MDEKNSTNDTNESSNSFMLSRSAQMVQAASPYLDESTKKTLEGIVHVTDFLETMQTFRQKGFSSMFSGFMKGRSKDDDTVSMTNLNSQAAALDTESILRSIRPYCTQSEGPLIDQILNMLNMQRIFKMYQTMQSMMSMMNMTNDNGKQTSDSVPPNTGPSKEYKDMNSYYDTYWNSFNNNNNNNTDNVSAYGEGSTQENTEYSFNSGDNTSTNNDNMNYDFTQDANNYNYNPTTNSDAYNQDLNSDNSNQNTNSNTSMLEMLSSLIPPEQKSTFDAMKLLLDSGMLK